MVKYCLAPGCANTYLGSSSLSFHRFPVSRPRILARWLEFAGLKAEQLNSTSFLCGDHFTEDSFTPTAVRTKLKSDAVPVLAYIDRSGSQFVTIPDRFSDTYTLPDRLTEEDYSTALRYDITERYTTAGRMFEMVDRVEPERPVIAERYISIDGSGAGAERGAIAERGVAANTITIEFDSEFGASEFLGRLGHCLSLPASLSPLPVYQSIDLICWKRLCIVTFGLVNLMAFDFVFSLLLFGSEGIEHDARE